MYFAPILFAVLTLLLFPSYIAAGAVGLATAVYFRFAGQGVPEHTIKLLRGQIAYRILSVKLLSLNGEMDEDTRSDEHTSELQSLMRISYAVFCLKTKKQHNYHLQHTLLAMTYQ